MPGLNLLGDCSDSGIFDSRLTGEQVAMSLSATATASEPSGGGTKGGTTSITASLSLARTQVQRTEFPPSSGLFSVDKTGLGTTLFSLWQTTCCPSTCPQSTFTTGFIAGLGTGACASEPGAQFLIGGGTWNYHDDQFATNESGDVNVYIRAFEGIWTDIALFPLTSMFFRIQLLTCRPGSPGVTWIVPLLPGFTGIYNELTFPQADCFDTIGTWQETLSQGAGTVADPTQNSSISFVVT